VQDRAGVGIAEFGERLHLDRELQSRLEGCFGAFNVAAVEPRSQAHLGRFDGRLAEASALEEVAGVVA